MADRNLDIALRIKADLDSARADVDKFNKTLDATGKGADSANAALGRSSERMNALLGNTDKMVQLLQSMDSQMAALASGSNQVAAATEEIAAGTQAASAGIKKLAETEEEATARIRAMIAASRERMAVEQTTAAAASDSAQAIAAQADSAEETAAAIQRQTAQTQRWTTAEAEVTAASRRTAAATADEAAELGRLLGQIDPVIAALERLDQQEAELQRFHARGLVDDEGFARFQSQINASRVAMGRMGVTSGQTAQAMRMLPAQLTDVTVSLAAGMPVWMVAIQQGGQIKDSFGGIRPAIANVLSLLTPFRLGIGLTAVSLGVLAAALVKGYLEAQHLESALIATGNYAGTTASELSNLADTVGATSGGYADASQAVLLLAQSGRVTREQMDDAARGAVAFAQISGKSIGEAVDAVVSLGKNPVEAVRKLDEQYHFLETSTYAQIRALQEQGRETDAAALAQRSFADAMQERQQRDVENLGSIQRGWKSLNDEIQRGWDLLKGVGSQATQQQLDQLYAQRGAAQSLTESFFTRNLPGIDAIAGARIAAIDKQIDALRDQAEQERQTAAAEGDHRTAQEAGSAALDRIAATTAKYANAAGRYSKELDDINANFDAAIKAMPEKAGELNQQRDEQLRAAVASYAKSLAGPTKGAGNAADREAEAQARAALTAQQDLIHALQDLQGQLDPTAKAWADYNAAVEETNRQAALAKRGPGANVAAIEAERVAVNGLHAEVRDKALAPIIEADQRAWETLRDSLRTPTEVKIDTAIAQIKQLNDLLAKGTINAQQYHDSVQRAAQNSVVAPPQYQGLDAAVGGAAGELQKNMQAGAVLDQWHAQQLAANDAFRAQDTANEEAYQARKAEIEKSYAEQGVEISRARQQLSLAVASEGFANLASVAQQAYGEQSKQYRIAFALSKGFAVAQAAVSLATNVSKASEVGFPYNIPLIVGAIAQGASIAAMISGAQFSGGSAGYADGGWTGPGGKYQVAGVVHAGEGVLTQEEISSLGGPGGFYALRTAIQNGSLRMPGYADGGYVSPLADVPTLPERSTPRGRLPAPAAGDRGQGGNKMRVYVLQNEDQLAQRLAEHPAMEKRIVAVAGENGTAIRASW